MDFKSQTATDEGFTPSLGAYREISCAVGIGESGGCSDGAEMIFDVYPPYGNTENSWYSSSSEEYSMEGFYQLDSQHSVSSLDAVNVISAPGHNLFAKSVFRGYAAPDPSIAVASGRSGQILVKKSLEFLCKIDEERKLALQNSSSTAAGASASAGSGEISDQNPKTGLQNKSAFQHMIAERNRRIKLKEHFSALHSLLPRNTKKDKHSILGNTRRYLCDLKLRLAELEQRNRTLQESISVNIIDVEGSSAFESQEQQLNSEGALLYTSDEVTLEQPCHFPCQVNIKINLQLNQVPCPTSVLIKVLELSREKQLEVLSIQSCSEAFHFHAQILAKPKGQPWDTSKGQNFGNLVRQCLL